MSKYIEALAVPVLWFLKNVLKVVPHHSDGNKKDFFFLYICAYSPFTYIMSCLIWGPCM